MTEAPFGVRSADRCAMAEILVLDVCARRPSAAGRSFSGVSICQAMRQHALYFRLFPLFSALFFRLAFSSAISMTFPVLARPDAL
jgi:hypothetical protein